MLSRGISRFGMVFRCLDLRSSGLLQGSPMTKRNFSVTPVASSRSMKIAILGAAGRTGSCLSLLLKQSRLLDELAIYDIAEETSALAIELSHIDTECEVTAACFENTETGSLRDVLDDAKIVVVTAGKPCDGKDFSPSALRANANILLDCIPNVIKYCPRALVALATSPIDYLVPLVVEIYKKHGINEHNRIFGITTLNCMRANTMAARIMQLEPECVTVPVIGGNRNETCVPVFSRTEPCSGQFSHEEMSKMTYEVRTAEERVNREYSGKGYSSLSMGYAAARFTISLCKALRDQRGVVEYAYTRSSVIPEVTYFTGPLELGPCGIQKYLGVPSLADHECQILRCAIPRLQEAIKTGEALVLDNRQ